MIVHVPPANNYSKVSSLDAAALEVRQTLDSDEAFWIGDFSRVRESLSLWDENLPDVKMHYAMKCCDEPNLLRYLADHGIGFDCASQAEMNQILGLGVDPNKIVFSHPLKSVKALKFAKEHGIERLVFDTEDELRKIMHHYPEAELFLRVKPRFSNAKIQLSNKFGAAPQDVPALLQAAKDHNCNFIGFSFHVGSRCDDLATFRTALEYIAELRTKAEDLGLNVCFIDLGGGFLPPNAPSNVSFQAIAEAIETAIEELFGADEVEFIGEPGRFVGSEYMDLYLPVIGTKIHTDEDGEISQSIYIPDGIYGSFNALNYDHAEPHFEILTEAEEDDEKIPTTLWGQTCDSADIVYQDMMWPQLEVGDMLCVHRFSAYTYSPTSFFNGFPHHFVKVINYEDEK